MSKASPAGRLFALLVVASAVASAIPGVARAADDPLTDRQKIVHALNRLGYGPRPGDVERVEKMGSTSTSASSSTLRRSMTPRRTKRSHGSTRCG